MWDKITYKFPNFNGCTIDMISSNTSLGMGLVIHAGIKVKTFQQKGPQRWHW